MLFHLRDAFRSGDIWLRHSRRYTDLKRALVPAETVATTTTLAVPRTPEGWLADRMTRMHAGLRHLANATRMGLLPGGSVEEGILRTDRTPVDPPADADELILDLYRRLPEVRITDILCNREPSFSKVRRRTLPVHVFAPRPAVPCTARTPRGHAGSLLPLRARQSMLLEALQHQPPKPPKEPRLPWDRRQWRGLPQPPVTKLRARAEHRAPEYGITEHL